MSNETEGAAATTRRSPARSTAADAEPVSPVDLEKRSWKYVFGRTVRSFIDDQCRDAAAGLTFYAVLSIFPALIAAFSLLGVVGQKGAAADAVLGIVDQAAPEDIAATLRGPIEELSQAPGAGLALITGILLALWSATIYVGAFSRAMNRIYGVEEGRAFWKRRPMHLLVTLVAVATLTIVAVSLVLSGDVVNAVGDAIGASAGVRTAWNIAKWPVLVIVVVIFIAVLYYATPNVKQPKFRWVSLGALMAIVVLALATAGFAVYVMNFADYEQTYGSLAGVIVFLLWLWIANLALLFGAEFDAELTRGRQLQAGIAAERTIRLPVRDTHRIQKRAEREQEDVIEGRRIRTDHE